MKRALRLLPGVVVALGLFMAPQASADPGVGCETVHWGLLGYQRRTVCDGPQHPDSSWQRARVVWVPAHYVPFTCSGGYYYSSCGGGYSVDDSLVTREVYTVFPDNVLPDEPGWLPPGTDNVF